MSIYLVTPSAGKELSGNFHFVISGAEDANSARAIAEVMAGQTEGTFDDWSAIEIDPDESAHSFAFQSRAGAIGRRLNDSPYDNILTTGGDFLPG